MDLSFTQERDAARAALRARLEELCPPQRVRALEASETGYCPELWQQLQREGWLAPAPLVDLALRFEELGRAATPGPFLASFEVQCVLAECGARVPAEGIGSLALLEASGAMDLSQLRLSCARSAAGHTLSGTKLFVPWAGAANRLLVVARWASGSGLALLLVNAQAQGLKRLPLASLGAERLFELRFEDVRLPADALLAEDAGQALESALARATLLCCAELSGLAQAALERAVLHARTREQFGRPIGAFQAVAHHCANMALDADAARLAVFDAAARVDAGESPLLHASRAKVVCAEAARRVTASAHQVMGGVGFLADSDLALFTRRAKALESRLGTPDWHRERLADARLP